MFKYLCRTKSSKWNIHWHYQITPPNGNLIISIKFTVPPNLNEEWPVFNFCQLGSEKDISYYFTLLVNFEDVLTVNHFCILCVTYYIYYPLFIRLNFNGSYNSHILSVLTSLLFWKNCGLSFFFYCVYHVEIWFLCNWNSSIFWHPSFLLYSFILDM